MKVAAYQPPLLAAGLMEALELIRNRVKWCEAEGVAILCCPEAILGGLADYAEDPPEFAVAVGGGGLLTRMFHNGSARGYENDRETRRGAVGVG